MEEYEMENCLFCKIISGDIPSSKVFENERVFAFKDINPQAPFHVLVVPKKHVASLAEISNLENDEIAACKPGDTVVDIHSFAQGVYFLHVLHGSVSPIRAP